MGLIGSWEFKGIKGLSVLQLCFSNLLVTVSLTPFQALEVVFAK